MIAKSKAPEFTPVVIELTFESQNEMDSFYSVMNNGVVCDFFKIKSGLAIGRIVREAFPDTARQAGKIVNALAEYSNGKF